MRIEVDVASCNKDNNGRREGAGHATTSATKEVGWAGRSNQLCGQQWKEGGWEQAMNNTGNNGRKEGRKESG